MTSIVFSPSGIFSVIAYAWAAMCLIRAGTEWPRLALKGLELPRNEGDAFIANMGAILIFVDY